MQNPQALPTTKVEIKSILMQYHSQQPTEIWLTTVFVLTSLKFLALNGSVILKARITVPPDWVSYKKDKIGDLVTASSL